MVVEPIQAHLHGKGFTRLFHLVPHLVGRMIGIENKVHNSKVKFIMVMRVSRWRVSTPPISLNRKMLSLPRISMEKRMVLMVVKNE